MNKTKYKILIIISVLLFVGSLGCAIFMFDVDKQTENTTTSYTATVKNVEINTETTSAMIYTNEYATCLHITSNIGKNIDLEDLRNLENGQTIYFQIENSYTQLLDEVAFLAATSLRSDEKTIFSLEDYNNYMQHQAFPARIVCGIVATVSLLATILCWQKIQHLKSSG